MYNKYTAKAEKGLCNQNLVLFDFIEVILHCAEADKNCPVMIHFWKGDYTDLQINRIEKIKYFYKK